LHRTVVRPTASAAVEFRRINIKTAALYASSLYLCGRCGLFRCISC